MSDDVNYFVATQYRLSRCAVWWRCAAAAAALSHSFAPLRLYAAAAADADDDDDCRATVVESIAHQSSSINTLPS